MRILFACGGTAGHINPALAMARMMQERRPGTEVLFVGAKGENLEHRLVPAAGYELRALNVNSFRRSLSLKALRHNLKALYHIPRSRLQARRLLREFKPDLVVGTGGFATYAVVRQAAAQGIATAIHESNVVPGLATRGLADHVDKVMVGFEGAQAHYRRAERVVVTGIPIRPDFFRLTRREAREAMGIEQERPLLLSFWGSLGASEMNRQTAELIALECAQETQYRHIHGAGGGYDSLMADLTARGIDLAKHPHIEVRPYIDDMPTVMAAADLVLCRAGASTMGELLARGLPSVLIPSPNVTGDHQTKNARLLADSGGAVLLPEPDCTPARLLEIVGGLLSDPVRRREMVARLADLTPPDALEQIYEVFRELTKK